MSKEEIRIAALDNTPKEKVHYNQSKGLELIPMTTEEIIASAKLLEMYINGTTVTATIKNL